MKAIDNTQIEELLSIAAGDVSYQSHYSRTTAVIQGGQWISKQSAGDYLRNMIEAERKAAYVPPVIPKVSGKRSEPYVGPFPRGRHSHRCKGCETQGQFHAVACYKSQCTKAQVTATCSYCARMFGPAWS